MNRQLHQHDLQLWLGLVNFAKNMKNMLNTRQYMIEHPHEFNINDPGDVFQNLVRDLINKEDEFDKLRGEEGRMLRNKLRVLKVILVGANDVYETRLADLKSERDMANRDKNQRRLLGQDVQDVENANDVYEKRLADLESERDMAIRVTKAEEDEVRAWLRQLEVLSGGAKRRRKNSTRKRRRRTARKKTRQRKPKRTLSKRKKSRGTRRRNR